jgi:hypothetical protein
MNEANYKKTIEVNGSDIEAYSALTIGIENWWTKPDSPINEIGDCAKFTFPPSQSYWVFQATKLIPNSRVELECIEAFHLHEGQPKEIETEWLATKVVFEIEPKESSTLIHFEHIGLNSELLCFDICEAGWNYFFLNSLKEYLETGKGSPHREKA